MRPLPADGGDSSRHVIEFCIRTATTERRPMQGRGRQPADRQQAGRERTGISGAGRESQPETGRLRRRAKTAGRRRQQDGKTRAKGRKHARHKAWRSAERTTERSTAGQIIPISQGFGSGCSIGPYATARESRPSLHVNGLMTRIARMDAMIRPKITSNNIRMSKSSSYEDLRTVRLLSGATMRLACHEIASARCLAS